MLQPMWVLSLECVFCVDGKVSMVELTALEQEDGYLAQVEIDEVTRFVSHVWSKISADNAMPCWIIFFVELLLDVCSNILCRGW